MGEYYEEPVISATEGETDPAELRAALREAGETGGGGRERQGGVSISQVGPLARLRRRSSVTSGQSSDSANATYQAS